MDKFVESVEIYEVPESFWPPYSLKEAIELGLVDARTPDGWMKKIEIDKKMSKINVYETPKRVLTATEVMFYMDIATEQKEIVLQSIRQLKAILRKLKRLLK